MWDSIVDYIYLVFFEQRGFDGVDQNGTRVRIRSTDYTVNLLGVNTSTYRVILLY